MDHNYEGGQNPSNAGGDQTPKNDQEVVLDESVLQDFDDETRKKIQTLDWQRRNYREKFQKTEDEKKHLEETLRLANEELQKLKPQPVFSDANPAPAGKDPQKVVLETLVNLERDKILASLPDEAREKVKDTFSALVNGKDVSPVDVASYMSYACKAHDLHPPLSTQSRITQQANGSVPPKGNLAPSKEQVEIARRSGTTLEEIEKADFSDFLGAEKLFSKEEQSRQNVSFT